MQQKSKLKDRCADQSNRMRRYGPEQKLVIWSERLESLGVKEAKGAVLEAAAQVENFNRLYEQLERDRTIVDRLRSRTEHVKMNTEQLADHKEFFVLEIDELTQYVLESVPSLQSDRGRRRFRGKLVEIGTNSSDHKLENSLYGDFILEETAIDSADPHTQYETVFLPDGLTLLEVKDAATGVTESLEYRYMREGNMLKELSFTLYNNQELLLEISDEFGSIRSQFTISDNGNSFRFYSPGVHKENPNHQPAVVNSSDKSPQGTSKTIQLTNYEKDPECQTLYYEDGVLQKQQYLDSLTGKYIQRNKNGLGLAYLEFGQLMYNGQVGENLNLEGVGQLVDLGMMNRRWEGIFRSGRILSGSMETQLFRYTGDFDDGGQPHGKGRVIFNNLDSYEGEMEHSKLHGEGTYSFYGGMKSYTGQFQSDKFHGKGSMRFQDGSVFFGTFERGNPVNGTLRTSFSHFRISEEIWAQNLQSLASENPLAAATAKLWRISTVLKGRTRQTLSAWFARGIGNSTVTLPAEISELTDSSQNKSEDSARDWLFEYEGDFDGGFRA